MAQSTQGCLDETRMAVATFARQGCQALREVDGRAPGAMRKPRRLPWALGRGPKWQCNPALETLRSVRWVHP